MLSEVNPFHFVLAIAWIGHACIWCRQLNYLYGCEISKKFLRPWRLATGAIIPAPLIAAVIMGGHPFDLPRLSPPWHDVMVVVVLFVAMLYFSLCLGVGLFYFPVITIFRLWNRQFDHGHALQFHTDAKNYSQRRLEFAGHGQYRLLARCPGNDLFRVDFTEVTLGYSAFSLADWGDAIPHNMKEKPALPAELEGLSILLLSDFHFYGTPSKAYFQTIIDEILSQPTPDIVALAGDFIDAVSFHDWIKPVLGQLRWNERGIAILGNHDFHFEPERVRNSLQELGFTVLGNRWEEATVRGTPMTFIGNESPWGGPPPSLKGMPREPFSICLSHSPDQFHWAVSECLDLVLCGHAHGGQIRLPVIGSIFVPCKSGRKYDQGVFKVKEWSDKGTLTEFRTTMVVSRGISGKEPIRFRCPPQVIRITLTGTPPAAKDRTSNA